MQIARPRPSYLTVKTALDAYVSLLNDLGDPAGGATWTCERLIEVYGLPAVVNDRDEPLEVQLRRYTREVGLILDDLRARVPRRAEAATLVVLRCLLRPS